MTALSSVLLILHFLGLAAVIGAFLVQVRRKGGFQTGWMITGLVTQLVTGLAMMGILDATTDGGANHAKLGVKLAVAVVALVPPGRPGPARRLQPGDRRRAAARPGAVRGRPDRAAPRPRRRPRDGLRQAHHQG
ncbi:hypothetical protein, partial [Curtobacterium citreum]|uniref:hypothetical protein n=1 Tax=Curtobacterium citreum TaxID=2036 RepID=UPI00128F778D